MNYIILLGPLNCWLKGVSQAPVVQNPDYAFCLASQFNLLVVAEVIGEDVIEALVVGTGTGPDRQGPEQPQGCSSARTLFTLDLMSN